MKKDPSYYRARIALIDHLLSDVRMELKNEVDPEAEKRLNKEISLLRNGHIPIKFPEDDLVTQMLTKHHYSNEVLTFTELTTYSTYFQMYPDRVVGKEVVKSSRDFPLQIEGSKEDVIQTIKNITTSKHSNTEEMELELEALALALKLKLLNFNSNSSLTGLNGLGALGKTEQEEVSQNLQAAKRALVKSQQEKSYSNTDKLTFNSIVKSYNKGISKAEIQAWVWYKRSLGVPMYGWDQYFLAGKDNSEIGKQIITIRETVIKDNHFRDISTVEKGKVLGRPTAKTLEYANDIFLIYRDAEGLRYVKQSDVQLQNTSLKTDPKALLELVTKGALFYLNGELIPHPIYTYGNMYDRQLQLEKDEEYIINKYGAIVFQNHQRVVQEARPTSLTVMNPDPNERPKILAVSEFAQDFQVSELRDETGITIDKDSELIYAFSQWLDRLDRSEFKESSAHDISTYYLEGKRLTDKTLSKDQKSETKTNARNEGERLFDRFLHEALTFEDQQKLDLLWNRTFNGQSNLAYHKIPVGFEASAKFKQFNLEIRPAQREGIAFMEATGSGLIAYDVGVGKTLTAIVTLANALQSGKAKRPLIVVPNPTYKKWIEEIIGYKDDSGEFVPGILSNTDVRINEWYNLGVGWKDKINLNKKVKEKTITIVTYEGFKKLGFSLKQKDSMFHELTNILAQSDVELSERDKEVEYQKYREKIGMGLKGTIADIDVLGFDYFVIDEAHRCKNVFEGVKAEKGGRKQFGLQGRTSELGIKAFFLCNYIQRTYGRNVCLLTATPFSNSPLEIYSMLSLIANNGMKQMGLTNIKRFFEMFVLETTEMVVNQAEEIVPKDVIRRFNNRLVLQKLIYNHINYKTGEEAGVKRPCKIVFPKTSTNQNGKVVKLKPQDQTLTYYRMTPKQRELQNDITTRARAAVSGGRPDSAALFRAMNASLNNALSPFLVEGMPEDYMEFVTESPKIHGALECIRTVKEYHEERGEPVSGQVIYLNRGKDFFGLIKEYLVKEIGFKDGVKHGKIKLNEVEFITGGMSSTKKENIKEAFLAGVVKIIIGTATIREGIDLQKNGTVIYNLYPDWNPTDLRQLEGRIWRQGNEFGYVRIVIPLVQDSMDVFVFQKLEEKTSRINDIWYRGDRGNVLELDSLDPEEIKFALLTDIEAIAEVKRKTIRKEQERKRDMIQVNIDILKEFTANRNQYEEYRKECLQEVTEWHLTIQHYDHIAVPLTSDQLKALDKEDREQIEKDIVVYELLTTFLESNPQEDKELLRLGRRLSATQHRFHADYKFTFFKEYLAKVKKAEKTILATKGYTAEDDITQVIKDFQNDLDNAKEEIKKINSEVYFEDLKWDVKQKKSAMAIDGKSVMERVQEFAKTNYLLSFKFNESETDTCFIPTPEMEIPPDDNELELELELEAIALALRLKLLNFAA